ncbi:hypothetical protein Tco_0849564, partial [Tanacetum coccineum]
VNEARDSVMSSASIVIYTSVYTNSEPGRVFWGADEELFDGVHYELQSYRTHTQMQDYRIASQESLMTTLIAQVLSLQGQLLVVLGQIQALQARDQAHADDPKGAGSSA